MRLRFFHIRHYPPLDDVAISFSAESLLQHQCAIRFVVGVNGSGKTHLQQAIFETFLTLARNESPPFRVPHYPVTLAYDLGRGADRTTLLFHSDEGLSRAYWWKLPEHSAASMTVEDWQALLVRLRSGEELAEQLITSDGRSRFDPYLPRAVLAYTTGSLCPWQELVRREPDASEVDLISQSLDYDATEERPEGWDRNQERRYQASQGTDEAGARLAALDASDQELVQHEQDQVLLLTPDALKLAFLAAVLNESLRDLEQSSDEAGFRRTLQAGLDAHDRPPGEAPSPRSASLRPLLTQVGWLWPVSIAWRLDLDLDRFKRQCSLLSRLKDLCELATTVVSDPGPMHIDLRQDDGDGPAIVRLQTFLGGADQKPYQVFLKLLDLQRTGLLADLDITLRKIESDDCLLFAELSDGEQMFLFRMALFHLLEDYDDALLLLDEPETHFNDKWKREIVDIIAGVMKDTANDILISTHSSITVSDVFDDEIIKLEKQDGHAVHVPVSVPTFGSDPSEIMINVFDVPDSIGTRALDWLNAQLKKEWTPDQKAELERVIRKIGPGLHRSELRTIWRKLNAPQD